MSIKSFQDYSRKFQEGEQLPKPKVFRCIKKSRDPSFGIKIAYDEERKGVIITDIDPESNASFAGMTIGSRIIEINGLVAQGATKEDVQFKDSFQVDGFTHSFWSPTHSSPKVSIVC